MLQQAGCGVLDNSNARMKIPWYVLVCSHAAAVTRAAGLQVSHH